MLPALSLLPSSSTSPSSKLSSMRPFQTPASKHLLLRTNKSPDFQSNQLQTAKANHLETTSPLPLITISTAIKAPLSIQLRSAYYRQHSFTVWSYNSHQSLFSCITGALKVLQILDSCPMPKRFWSDGCSGISRPVGFFNMCMACICIWCTPSPQRSPLPLSGFRSGSSVQLTGGSASQPGGGGAIGYRRPFQPSQLLHLLSSAFKWVESNTRTLYSLDYQNTGKPSESPTTNFQCPTKLNKVDARRLIPLQNVSTRCFLVPSSARCWSQLYQILRTAENCTEMATANCSTLNRSSLAKLASLTSLASFSTMW